MNRRYRVALSAVIVIGMAIAACFAGTTQEFNDATPREIPSASVDTGYTTVAVDSVLPGDVAVRYKSLTDEDFRLVADELKVEVAVIKAVVLIEAGKAMTGFWGPGLPVVNCDRSMWSRVSKMVTNREKAPSDATVPDGLVNARARKAWQKLINARKSGIQQANLSTFWGMFQIGGFNYKRCGCASIEEFVELMSYSELEQLELFAAFITNCGYVQYLRDKNWSAFARKYNGTSYARRGYHTRMAAAYKRFKAEE